MSAAAPICGALRIRTEFAHLACSFVERGIVPGPSCDGLWVVRTGPRAGCQLAGSLASFDSSASIRAGRLQAEGKT